MPPTNWVAKVAILFFFSLTCVAAPYEASVRVVESAGGLCTYTVVPTDDSGVIDDDMFIMVYDAGSGSACTEAIKAHLGHAVKQIDLLIISHNAWPHYGGATYLLRDFDVGEIWHSGDRDNTPAWRAFAAALASEVAAGAKLRLMSERAVTAGERRFITPDTYITALFGPGLWEWGGVDGEVEIKARSIVIQLNAGQSQMLFAGDIIGRDSTDEVDACRHSEGLLVSKLGERLRSTILLVPDHGRLTSSTPCFLKAVAPKFAIVPTADTLIQATPSIYANLIEAGVEHDKIFQTSWVAPDNDDEDKAGLPGCRISDIQLYLYSNAPPKIGYANTKPTKCDY